jgi:polyisoprenyl-teichoic acid--peptidoglycan teichoic acid transferase
MKEKLDKKSVDFLESFSEQTETQFKKFSEKNGINFFDAKKITGIIVAAVIIMGLTYSTRAVVSGDKLSQSIGNLSVIEQIKHLVGSDNKPVLGEEENRTNILILGIGGEEHEGGQLTDTIMIASIEHSTNRVGILSIPRDLVAPIPGVGWQKINAANAFGYFRNKNEIGAGPNLAAETVKAITGLEMHYYIKIDFKGFVKIIDALGGIRINVPQTFSDYQYPDNNNGYAPVHFKEGWHTFNGETALKYARSRHGTAGEGSDFARAKRQQEILRSIQGRVLGVSTLLNPNKLVKLAEIVGENMETNMQIWEAIKFYEIAKKIDTSKINQIVIETGGHGLVRSEINEDGSYILRPRLGAGIFTEIQNIAQNLLTDNPYSFLSQKEEVITTKNEKIKIAVLNGTTIPGLASNTAEMLRLSQYNITQIGNATNRNYEKTVIYNITGENSEETIKELREKFNANISTTIPQFIEDIDADILIIVGKDRSV